MLWSCSQSDPFHLQFLLSTLWKCWIESTLRDFCTSLCCVQRLGQCERGPCKLLRELEKLKAILKVLDFILSDPTEFLTVSGQGIKQGLCRWLWFAWLCPAGLQSAGCDLKNESKWKSRWQTEMPSPLTRSHSWLWRGVCQNNVSAVWFDFHVYEIISVSFIQCCKREWSL